MVSLVSGTALLRYVFRSLIIYQTYRHTYRHTYRQTDRDRQRHWSSTRHTDTHTDRHRHTDTHTDRHRHTDTHTDRHWSSTRQTDTHTDRHTDRQTDRDTDHLSTRLMHNTQLYNEFMSNLFILLNVQHGCGLISVSDLCVASRRFVLPQPKNRSCANQ